VVVVVVVVLLLLLLLLVVVVVVLLLLLVLLMLSLFPQAPKRWPPSRRIPPCAQGETATGSGLMVRAAVAASRFSPQIAVLPPVMRMATIRQARLAMTMTFATTIRTRR